MLGSLRVVGMRFARGQAAAQWVASVRNRVLGAVFKGAKCVSAESSL